MEKIDFKKADRRFYTAKTDQWVLVDVPEWQFLQVDGQGDPNSAPDYSNAVLALYRLSYGLKFRSKSVHGRDYVVGPLEGLWWADDMDAFRSGDRAAWKWRMMIRQPDWIDGSDLDAVRAAMSAKPGEDAVRREKAQSVSLVSFREGMVLQRLYFGPYADEAPVLIDLHDRFLPENGFSPTGRHHEIYLNDPRKVAPDKIKTILRQPVDLAGDSTGAVINGAQAG